MTPHVTVTTVVALFICVVPLLLVFIFFPSAPLLKVVSWFPISIWKTRAAFSTRPLLCVVNCAYGQHESCFWYRRAASVKSTLFLLDLLKTAPRVRRGDRCIYQSVAQWSSRGFVWNSEGSLIHSKLKTSICPFTFRYCTVGFAHRISILLF